MSLARAQTRITQWVSRVVNSPAKLLAGTSQVKPNVDLFYLIMFNLLLLFTDNGKSSNAGT